MHEIPNLNEKGSRAGWADPPLLSVRKTILTYHSKRAFMERQVNGEKEESLTLLFELFYSV